MKDLILGFIRGVFGTKRLIKMSEKQQKLSQFNFYELRRFQLIEHILHDTERGVTTERYTDHDIIVSLTTYGKRIHEVAFTIESIMQQTMKPNRIILWLDYSFQNKRLPQSLLYQQKRGLEIAYCKDLRSYKKLIPSLSAYPNDAIITIDDDLIYDYDILEHLIVSYLEHPKYIHSCRGHQMQFDKNHELLPYMEWRLRVPELGIIDNYFLTGGGGTLYPPGCLDEEVLNEDVFLGICEHADDVWFNAMARKKGTIIYKVYTRSNRGDDYIVNETVQDVGLLNINIMGHKLNDVQLKSVFTKYSIYEKLK